MGLIQLVLLGCLLIYTGNCFVGALGDNDMLVLVERARQKTFNLENGRNRQEREPPPSDRLPIGDVIDVLESEEERECQPLERLLEEFVTCPYWSTYNEYVSKMTSRNRTMDDFWRYKKQYLGGLDLRKPNDRHRLACLIYCSSNLTEAFKKLGVPANKINRYTSNVHSFIMQVGGSAAGFESLVELSYDYGTWVAATGYPTLPLKKNVTRTEMEEKMRQWLRLYYSFEVDDWSRGLLNYAAKRFLLPIHLNPEYTAFILGRARKMPTVRLLETLGLREEHYEVFVKYDLPKVIIASAEIGKTAARILNDLDDRGFLNF